MANRQYRNFGQSDIPATTNTDLMVAVPAGKQRVVNVLFTNRTGSPKTVRLYHRINGIAVAVAQAKLYDASVDANGILEFPSIPCAAGDMLTVYAGATGVSGSADGFEEAN